MFNLPRLFQHVMLAKCCVFESYDARERDIRRWGGTEQCFRNQNMFCIWNLAADKLQPFLADSNHVS